MSKRKGIPENAKKAFAGKLFEVWQWEQKMYDGSTEIFERLKRPNTAQVIAVVGDKILVQDEEQPSKPGPFTALPGGRCDGEEDPLKAAKRELLEETGYVSDDWAEWNEVNPVGKMEWTVYTYVARDCRYVQEPQLDNGEKISPRFITLDELLLLSDDPHFYSPEIVPELLRMRLHPAKKEAFRKLLWPSS